MVSDMAKASTIGLTGIIGMAPSKMDTDKDTVHYSLLTAPSAMAYGWAMTSNKAYSEASSRHRVTITTSVGANTRTG